MNVRAWMVQWVFVVWMVLVVSALMVVYSKFTLRGKVSELQILSSQLSDAQVELGQLMLEQGTVASYDRVERYASQELQMRAPEYDEVVWLGMHHVWLGMRN